jgi:hypothetical protein
MQEWFRDIEARQHNVVFPDTAENEGRFWRNLYTGKQKPTVTQSIGIVIMAIMVLALVFITRYAVIQWAFALGVLGAFMLLIKWATRPKKP